MWKRLPNSIVGFFARYSMSARREEEIRNAIRFEHLVADIKWPPLRATVKTSEINATDNWGEMWEDGFVGGQK